jgi:benzodiazapine receptor
MSSEGIDNSALSFARREAPAKDMAALAVSLLLALSVAAIAGLATWSSVDGWYAHADRTLWNPPNQVFGPVWSVLYSVMAVAAWLVWRQPGSPERTVALRTYIGQLALNACWPPMFFLLYDVVGGVGLWVSLGWIVLLDFAVLATIVFFWRVSRLASLMLFPYWTWLLFATALNASLAVMNS